MTAINKAREAVPHGAIEALANNQRQLDMDGVEVGVSRQAIDEVLAWIPVALSALDQPSSVRMGVKPLEWRDHRGHTFPDTWTAKTPCGVYEIEERSASDSPAYIATGPLHVFIADKDGLDDAKAAAQADYEARILSALDLSAIGAVLAAGKLMVDDHQTSEKHHPNHVLVPLNAFEAMRTAVAMLGTALSPPEPRS